MCIPLLFYYFIITLAQWFGAGGRPSVVHPAPRSLARPSIWLSAPECTRRPERVRLHPGSWVCNGAGASSEAKRCRPRGGSRGARSGAQGRRVWPCLLGHTLPLHLHCPLPRVHQLTVRPSSASSVYPSCLQPTDSVSCTHAGRFALYFRGHGDRRLSRADSRSAR